MSLVAFDFESEAIDTRPNYPPIPVGLAVYVDGEQPYYMAWGHPTANNCTFDHARRKFASILQQDHQFIAHNLPFDAAIVEERFELSFPWYNANDSMLQAFLLNPFGELSLKPLAEFYLGEAPTERDAVRDWLVANGVCRALDKSWGAHISKAPGDVVGPYAIGDVRKTMGLYKLFKDKIDQRSSKFHEASRRYTYTPGEDMSPEEAARTLR